MLTYDYISVTAERETNGQPATWQVSRWTDGLGKFLGRHLPHEEATALANQNANGLPVRQWRECVTCGTRYPEPFMVHGRVWHEAKLGRGVIHIQCLETRLGRKLTPDDFNLELPINAVLAAGIRMGTPTKSW